MDQAQQIDHAEHLAVSREAEAERMREWEIAIVADIAENGPRDLDWTGAGEGDDLVSDAFATAADSDLAGPYVLMRTALREAGVWGDRNVQRALQEVAMRYRNCGFSV